MKIKSLFSTALLGTVALLLAGHSVKAALPFNTGDLLLGFRTTDGQGSNRDYLVNLGSVANYAPGQGSFTIDSTKLGVTKFNLGADLTARYGSSWNTLSEDQTFVQWGVVGTNGDFLNPILYASRERLTIGTQSTPWSGQPEISARSTQSAIQQLQGYYKSQGAATANNSVGTLQNTTNASSYYAFLNGGANYGSNLDFNVWSNIEGNFANGTANSVFDLYLINPVDGQASVYQGSFQISDSGVLTYFAAELSAVPEPREWGVTFAIGLFLLVFIRARRRVA